MDNLPVEVLHRIFDSLDIETLFFSIRSVCRYLRSTVDDYDRLDFHLKFISKCHFDALCRLISPENLRSLTLYNNEEIPNQISLFLSRIRLRHLTKLHSIHLDDIEEFQFDYLFKRINLNLLQSFSGHLIKYDNLQRKTTANHLSKIVRQLNLRTIEFDMYDGRVSLIEWPSNCSIQCLIANGDMNFANLVQIYSCSPQLHRLVIRKQFAFFIFSHPLTFSFPQLTSLIVEQLTGKIDEIEAFLSLTPSLIYLKLIGGCSMFNGKRWEDFIQANLPHLNRFEFNITCMNLSAHQSRGELDSLVQSYRSAFWIEHKKWFMLAELDLENPYFYRIYSLPMCQCSYEYNFSLIKLSPSTSNEICPTESISQLKLRFPLVLNEKDFSSMSFAFSNVTKLHLYFDGALPVHCQSYLCKIVDVYQLIEVKLENRYFYEGDEHFLSKLFQFLEKSPRLSSLTLHLYDQRRKIYRHLETIMQLLPRQINYLQIPIKEVKHIEILLERCPYLFVVRFTAKSAQRSREIKQWFKKNTLGSIYQRYYGFAHIWIGKKNDDKEEDFNSKRMKISEDFLES